MDDEGLKIGIDLVDRTTKVDERNKTDFIVPESIYEIELNVWKNSAHLFFHSQNEEQSVS